MAVSMLGIQLSESNTRKTSMPALALSSMKAWTRLSG